MKIVKYLIPTLLAGGILVFAAVKLSEKINAATANNQKSEETRSFKTIPKAQLAYMRAEHEYMMARDPKTNAIPDNIKQLEQQFASKIPTREEFYSSFVSKGNRDYPQAQNWHYRGPSNLSGRVLALGVDRNNENIIFAGSASGGMWRSTDGGKTWTRVSPPGDEQSVTCIVQDARPGKRNTWYYGTGELMSTTDRSVSLLARTIGIGNGIFKSTDNGSTWEPLASTRGFGAAGSLTDAFQGVWDIAIDTLYKDQDIVYAACYGGIMRSADGGGSWTKVLGDAGNKSFSSDIAICRNGYLYAALSDNPSSIDQPQSRGIWRSTDGISWERITPANFPDKYFTSKLRIVMLALAPSNHNVLYVLTETPYTGAGNSAFTSVHTIWKYTENQTTGKGTWESRSQNLPGGYVSLGATKGYNTLGGYAFTLAVKPDNENVVLIGGTNLFLSKSGFSDTLSTNHLGGYPYKWDLDTLHPDMQDLMFSPTNPNRLWAACDGGVYRTDNCMAGTVTWHGLNQGLSTSQFYSVAIEPFKAGDNFIFGGLQDNSSMGSNSADASVAWDFYIGGDGMQCVVAKDKKYVIGSIYNGEIYTVAFDSNMTDIRTSPQKPQALNSVAFPFYTVFALDVVNSKTFYLPALNKIWRKEDMTKALFNSQEINRGWSEIVNARIPDGQIITAIALSRQPDKRLYYGTQNGYLYRLDSADKGTVQSINVTGSSFPQNGYICAIDIDTRSSDNVFAVFSNYNVQSIFHSTNGGATWLAVGGNLEDNPDGSGAGPSVRWIKMLHVADKTIYFLGTSVGLFSTNELAGGQTMWLREAVSGIGSVMVDMIDARESDGYVAIATHGNGIYGARVDYSLPVEDYNVKTVDNIRLSQNYPNPATDRTTIGFTLTKTCNVKLAIHDSFGRIVSVAADSYLASGSHSVDISCKGLAQGNYFYRLETQYGTLTRKFIVSR